MTAAAAILLACALFAIAVHLLSLAIVARRARRAVPAAHPVPASVSIVRPVSQRDSYLRETLASTFGVVGDDIEIIFCAARESDPAVPVVRELLALHPRRRAFLLIGESLISQNPKLNNCVKGWQAARHDLVALIDSNVMLPADYIGRMMAPWDSGCGLVTSPPVGAAPGSFWAMVECAFLNTHQARWQLVADELGAGFAQGKNLLFRKSILEPLGGIASLAGEAAEDAAATKVLRAAGYHVRLSQCPFPQPLGHRSLRQFWQRQVRWAKLRRATFPVFYLPEVLAGSFAPFVLSAAGLVSCGASPLLPLVLLAAAWFGGEILLASVMGWHRPAASIPAMMVRDLMIPAIWIAGLTGNGFEWQGHRMTARRAEAGASAG